MKISRIPGRVRQYVDRTRDIRTAARDAYGVRWLPLQLRAMRLRKRYGWGLDESLAAGLLDPDTTIDPETAASPRQTTDLQYMVNARQIEAISEDKTIFHMMAAAAGLPGPRTYATFMRGAHGWDHVHSRPIHPGGWEAALQSMPDELVLKPAAGYHGHGVQVLVRHGFGWTSLGRGEVSTPEVVSQMRAHHEFGDWIAQERLHNHPDLRHLRSEALHTLRLVTFIGDDGTPELLWAGFRIAAPDRAIDNFRGGRMGNMTCEIDLSDGAITGAYIPREDAPGLVAVCDHPVTGGPITGLRLPLWEAAVDLVLGAATLFLPLRTIGFDVGLTPEGPKLVEINMWWDVPPVAPMRHTMDRLWRLARG